MKAIKRFGLILGFAVLSSMGALGQFRGLPGGLVTISGNLKDLNLTNSTQQSTYVVFFLKNYGSNIPRVVGTNAIVSATSEHFTPDSMGNIAGSIQSNDTISPANTFYRVCVFNRGL